MRHALICIVSLLLAGCGLAGPCGNGDPFGIFQYCEKEISYAYGAHWIKDGMTRESRAADWLACGGDDGGKDGYKDWLSSVPYETYDKGKTIHIKNLVICVKSKGYVYLEKCDARCLYP